MSLPTFNLTSPQPRDLYEVMTCAEQILWDTRNEKASSNRESLQRIVEKIKTDPDYGRGCIPSRSPTFEIAFEDARAMHFVCLVLHTEMALKEDATVRYEEWLDQTMEALHRLENTSIVDHLGKIQA